MTARAASEGTILEDRRAISVPDPVADEALRLATCPLCHTTDPITTIGALDAGGDWRCRKCHQNWSARRLATVAAYASWSRNHDGDPTG